MVLQWIPSRALGELRCLQSLFPLGFEKYGGGFRQPAPLAFFQRFHYNCPLLDKENVMNGMMNENVNS